VPLIVITVTFVAPPESLSFTLNVRTLLTPVTGFGFTVAHTFEANEPKLSSGKEREVVRKR
jgi:hypothetical protein